MNAFKFSALALQRFDEKLMHICNAAMKIKNSNDPFNILFGSISDKCVSMLKIRQSVASEDYLQFSGFFSKITRVCNGKKLRTIFRDPQVLTN